MFNFFIPSGRQQNTLSNEQEIVVKWLMRMLRFAIYNESESTEKNLNM